ncbi:unnamed protein product, partial [Scytosiphon promiscuus]
MYSVAALGKSLTVGFSTEITREHHSATGTKKARKAVCTAGSAMLTHHGCTMHDGADRERASSRSTGRRRSPMIPRKMLKVKYPWRECNTLARMLT